jgi:iron complex outermembrane receptor protein
MKTQALIFAALLLIFAPLLHAQEEVEEALEDLDLVMEGEGLTLEEDWTASPAIPLADPYGGRRNVVSAEEIQEQGSLDLLDALRNVPGVMFSKRNAVGTNTGSSLYVRGRGYTHPSLDTTVSFDGVPRFGLIYGQTMADSISVFTAGSVEVFKSPAPSSFGAGYAAVNVVPRQQSGQGWSVEGGFSGGSYVTWQENLGFGLRKGPFDVYAAESFVSTEGHIVHSGARQQNYYLNTGYWINAYWNVRAIFEFTDAETLQAPAAGQSKSDILATFKTGSIFTTATLNNEYDRAKGLLKLYYNHTDFDWLDDNPQAEGDYSKQLLRGGGLRARETFSIREGSLAAGTDLDINMTTNEDHNTTSASVITRFPLATLFSPYAAASYTFRPGGDFYLIPQGAFRGFVHSVWDNSVSPQAGITAGWRYLEIAGFYSRGVIYPAPALLQSLINAGNLDGADLGGAKPETVNHFEGNFSFNGKTIAINLAYYFDDGQNRILASGAGAPGNAASAAYFQIEGFEAGGQFKTGRKGVFLESLEITGSAAWITKIRARGETGPEVDSMPYTPLFSATAALRWDVPGGFSLGGDYQFLHKIYGGNLQYNASFAPISESRRLPDIHLLNLRLSYSFSHKPWRLSSCEIFAQANNVLNRKYEYYQGYEMPGIACSFGVKATVK